MLTSIIEVVFAIFKAVLKNDFYAETKKCPRPYNTSAPKTTGAWDTTKVPHAPAKGDKNGLSELKVGIMLIFVIRSS
jgi:hypothetical protein